MMQYSLMRNATALVLLAALILAPSHAYSAPADISIEESSYTVSVDPTDPWMGVLTIKGEVSAKISGILETLTVTLSSNITEMGPSGATGQYWHSVVSFEGGPANTPSHIFRRGDPSKTFSVKLDPDLYDPQQTRDVPVPEGLPLDHWGDLVVTATYSGSSEGTSRAECRIEPEPFYLLNISMNTRSHEMRAGEILNYTAVIKNPSNMDAGVELSVPLLDQLSSSGWRINISIPDMSLLEPGSKAWARFILTAPDTIPQDNTLRFEVTASTTEIDPDSLEPEFIAVAGFDLILFTSSVKEGPDENGDPANGEEKDPYDIVLVIVIMTVVAIAIIILVVILMSRKGGGEDGNSGDDKTYSAPVRM